MISQMDFTYVLRLACTNGAISNTVVREFSYSGGEGDDIWQWFRHSIKEAYRGFTRIVKGYEALAAEEVAPADRPLYLENLLKQAGVRGVMAEAVRARALEEPPRTAYDMMNLLTWASSHLLEEPRQIIRAQAAAAHFSEETTHARSCPVCHRAR